MNKKILVSLGIIGLAGALAIGATTAFFSDTETSAGNILVAGSLDLKVDHTKQTYNNVDCATCDVEIKSDISNLVIATVDGSDTVPFPHPAIAVSNPHSAWTVSGDIPDATWIWATDPTLQDDTTQNISYTFEKEFEWYGPVDGIILTLGVGADNGFEVFLNGNPVGADASEFNYKSPAKIYSGFGSFLIQGTNKLTIKVSNKGMASGTPTRNPGGLLYKLIIDGQCEGDYFKTHCQLWGLKDIEDEKFFNLDDIKPGDYGTNVISLHAYDNDAWVCLLANNFKDNDNGLTEPEEQASDSTGGDGEGELSQYLNFVIWEDENQNGIHQSSETILFGPSNLTDPTKVVIGDSTTNPIIGSTTEYIGLAWCAGTQVVEGDGTITCDGSSMGNNCQSDSLSADLILYAEQWRNNPDFTCEDLILEEEK